MIYGHIAGSHAINSIDCTYEYRRPGTDIPFPPDSPDSPERPGATGGSARFADGYAIPGWSGRSIGDLGLDVALEFCEQVFVDQIIIEVADQDSVDAISLFIDPSENAGHRFCADTISNGNASLDTSEARLSAGFVTSCCTIRFKTRFRDLAITRIEVWGCDAEPARVYPTPATFSLEGEEKFMLDELNAIIAVGDADGDARFAADFCAELLSMQFGADAPVGEDEADLRASAIVFRRHDRAADSAANSDEVLKPTVGAVRDRGEAYTISVRADLIEVAAHGRIGLLYAASTLLQLFTPHDNGVIAADACRIDDRPAFGHRGVHLGLPPREELEFFSKLVRHLLVPYRYNTVFLEFAGGMEFERHPEINEGWRAANEAARAGEQPAVPHGDMVAGGGVLTRAEVTGVVETLKSHGLEVIPEVQSLSHVQYLTISHPELAEIPSNNQSGDDGDVATDDQKPVGYHHCYCPLAPGVYDIVFDMIDEIVDVVQPERFVHLGHDEVYEIGTCARCKSEDKAKLFADDVRTLDEHVKSKGLRSMIWADMLQPRRQYGTEGAIDSLSRDVVLLDFVWYFYLDEEIEDHLLDHGFEVIMGNLYSSHYPRYERRIRKPGMVGGEVSTWKRVDEHTLASTGKLYDFMYTAEMLWSERYDSRLRWSVDRSIRQRIPMMRTALRGKRSSSTEQDAAIVPVDLRMAGDGHQTTEVSVAVASISAAEQFTRHVAALDAVTNSDAVQHSTSDVQPRRPQVAVSAPDFHDDLPKRCEIPIDGRTSSLVFHHACDARRPPGDAVGRYVVRFADGERMQIPLEYGYNITAFDRRHDAPLAHPAYRHYGYVGTYTLDEADAFRDRAGNAYTVYRYEWENPRPEVGVEAVVLEAGSAECGVPVYVFELARVISGSAPARPE